MMWKPQVHVNVSAPPTHRTGNPWCQGVLHGHRVRKWSYKIRWLGWVWGDVSLPLRNEIICQVRYLNGSPTKKERIRRRRKSQGVAGNRSRSWFMILLLALWSSGFLGWKRTCSAAAWFFSQRNPSTRIIRYFETPYVEYIQFHSKLSSAIWRF
jgi:hypothetical protein